MRLPWCMAWGETKKRINLMLTQSAIDLVDEASDDVETSRSEIIEWAIRKVYAYLFQPLNEEIRIRAL
jgi:metal-responsive CopG/Arc/MetJ family transcriptional regulator